AWGPACRSRTTATFFHTRPPLSAHRPKNPPRAPENPPRLPPDDADRTDRLALAQHRHVENAPPTPCDGKVCRVLGILLNIRDVDDVSRQNRASGRLLSIGLARIHP